MKTIRKYVETLQCDSKYFVVRHHLPVGVTLVRGSLKVWLLSISHHEGII